MLYILFCGTKYQEGFILQFGVTHDKVASELQAAFKKEKVYPFEKTAEAMRYAGEGHAKGKVVIAVAGSQEVNYFTFRLSL